MITYSKNYPLPAHEAGGFEPQNIAKPVEVYW